jgi:hypothetical protein
MRYIKITSNGFGNSTEIYDEDTGEKLIDVQKIEFADLEPSKPFLCILHRGFDRITQEQATVRLQISKPTRL